MSSESFPEREGNSPSEEDFPAGKEDTPPLSGTFVTQESDLKPAALEESKKLSEGNASSADTCTGPLITNAEEHECRDETRPEAANACCSVENAAQDAVALQAKKLVQYSCNSELPSSAVKHTNLVAGGPVEDQKQEPQEIIGAFAVRSTRRRGRVEIHPAGQDNTGVRPSSRSNAMDGSHSSILLPEYYNSHCQTCYHRTVAPIPCWCCAKVTHPFTKLFISRAKILH